MRLGTGCSVVLLWFDGRSKRCVSNLLLWFDRVVTCAIFYDVFIWWQASKMATIFPKWCRCHIYRSGCLKMEPKNWTNAIWMTNRCRSMPSDWCAMHTCACIKRMWWCTVENDSTASSMTIQWGDHEINLKNYVFLYVDDVVIGFYHNNKV